MAHIKPILCVFGTPFYSSGYTAPEVHHQLSKRHPNNTCWRLVCVADLVGASSLAAAKTGPKNACWCRALAGFKSAFPCTTHTHQFPFVHLLNIQSKASMQKRSKNNAKRAPELYHISLFFFSPCNAVVGGAAISLRRRPARRHLVSTARTQTR
jgi:hypothetical protein